MSLEKGIYQRKEIRTSDVVGGLPPQAVATCSRLRVGSFWWLIKMQLSTTTISGTCTFVCLIDLAPLQPTFLRTDRQLNKAVFSVSRMKPGTQHSGGRSAHLLGVPPPILRMELACVGNLPSATNIATAQNRVG